MLEIHTLFVMKKESQIKGTMEEKIVLQFPVLSSKKSPSAKYSPFEILYVVKKAIQFFGLQIIQQGI